jgi:hypothetical protein
MPAIHRHADNPIGIGKSTPYDAHDGDDNESQGFSKGGGALSGDGREHGEHKCDKARRCSRLVRPLGDRKKRNASSCSVPLTMRTGFSSSPCRSVSSRSPGGERGQGPLTAPIRYRTLSLSDSGPRELASNLLGSAPPRVYEGCRYDRPRVGRRRLRQRERHSQFESILKALRAWGSSHSAGRPARRR